MFPRDIFVISMMVGDWKSFIFLASPHCYLLTSNVDWFELQMAVQN